MRRRWIRATAGASLTLLMVLALSTPGMAANYSKPLPQQWWFTAWGVQERLWPVTQGKGVTVAVLDTGVEASIPDLSGVVLAGTDVSGGSGDGRTDTDDAPVPGHGTGMASLIAAQGAGTGFVGVAPKAKILPVVTKSANAHAQGIRYAVNHGAKVINISRVVPTSCPSNVQQAVAYAIEHDVIVIAGAGNTGDEGNASNSPANCAGVMAVGAVNPSFSPWPKTQRQSYVAVAAPGDSVGFLAKDGRFHDTTGGTSNATALTSAAVALVRAKFPDMSARQVVQQVIGSAGDVGAKGHDDQTGYGLIRPYRILNGTVPKSGPNPVFAAYDKWAAANGKNAGAVRPRSNAAESDSSSKYVIIGAVAVPLVAVIVMLLIVRSKNQRRVQAAGADRYGTPGMPQSFGGPYPPQGGQPPMPGAQPPYYPGAGPQGGPPPPQGAPPPHGRYPNPGQWDAPDQRS